LLLFDLNLAKFDLPAIAAVGRRNPGGMFRNDHFFVGHDETLPGCGIEMQRIGSGKPCGNQQLNL
jgi:hypothetical protein